MRVKMEHPDLGSDRQQWVRGDQFDLVWKNEGWVEVERVYETGEAEYVPPAPDETVPLPNSWELHEETKPKSSKAEKNES